MPKLIVTAFVSIDGVMQGPGGAKEDTDGGFTSGGWFIPHFDQKMGEIIGPLLGEAGSYLLGRKTYEIFSGHWGRTTNEDPMAKAINEAKKYVASKTLKSADWTNSELLQGDTVAAIAKIKEGEGKPIVVQGSANLVQTLFANDLVDEVYAWVAPCVLGKGKRLFGEGAKPGAWELVSSTPSTTGVLINHYRRAGALRQADAPTPEQLNEQHT